MLFKFELCYWRHDEFKCLEFLFVDTTEQHLLYFNGVCAYQIQGVLGQLENFNAWNMFEAGDGVGVAKTLEGIGLDDLNRAYFKLGNQAIMYTYGKEDEDTEEKAAISKISEPLYEHVLSAYESGKAVQIRFNAPISIIE
jgi:hypothetical protein